MCCLCVSLDCKCGGVALGHYCDIKLLYSSAGSEIVVIGGHLPIRPTIKLIRDDIHVHILYTLDNERLNWMEPANSQYNIIELNSSLDGRYQLIPEQISSRNVSSKLNRLNVTKAILFSKLNHNKTRFSSIKHDGRLKTTTYVCTYVHTRFPSPQVVRQQRRVFYFLFIGK